MKTEYRIITVHGTMHDRFLQFKTVHKRKKFFLFGPYIDVIKWRFVPEPLFTAVHGYWLTQESCPTSLGFYAYKFVSCFKGHENFYGSSPGSFARSWPDIEKYFEKLRKERKEYLKEQAEPDAPTVYL